MKNKGHNTEKEIRPKKIGKVEIRPDLEDGSRGKDLSYLNEFPQFSRDEGVKAGVPPPKEKNNQDGKLPLKENSKDIPD